MPALSCVGTRLKLKAMSTKGGKGRTALEAFGFERAPIGRTPHISGADGLVHKEIPFDVAAYYWGEHREQFKQLFRLSANKSEYLMA